MVNNKTFVIAEIGVNHNGSVQTAKKLILSAKRNNADAVKFQSFSADRLAFKHTPKVKYQKKIPKKMNRIIKCSKSYNLVKLSS